MIGYCAMALLIPLHKLIIYRTTQRCFPSESIKIYQKFLLGVAIQIANTILLLVFDIIARRANFEHYRNVSRCIFDHNQHGLGSSFNHNWVAITRVLDSISLTLFCISAVEFFASQTPYLMRGLIFGVGYGNMHVHIHYYWVWYLLAIHSSFDNLGHRYLQLWILVSTLSATNDGGLLLAVVRWYKNRKSEDVLPNEHIFAERYYAQP